MDDFEDIEALENKKTAHKLPMGWLLFYVGFLLFGIYYIAAYTPAFSGWTQVKAYEESVGAKE